MYLDVLLQYQFRGYIAEIIIEGHTDTDGGYQSNMELSYARANAVADFCLNQKNGLSEEKIEQLQKILTVNGKSWSNPVYKEDADGNRTETVDMASSRRVEIKFRLKEDEMIEKIKKKELAEFSQLLIANKITSSFYQLVSNDRDCFYAFVSSWLYSWDMLKIYRNEETDSSIMREKQTLNRLQKNFEHYYPDDIRLMDSPSWPFYGVFMYIQIYKSFYLKHVARNNIEGLLSSNLHFTFWFEQVKQSFPEEILESALAFLIHNQAVGDGLLIEASIPAFQYFKEKYPLSHYLKYFHQHIERVEALFSEEKPDTSIHFLENEPDLNTLSKLLTRFKGEKLYIDIWSPTCGPCRTEFQYCDSLEMILKQNNVTPLYISLDRGNKDAKQWKALVRYYNLKGYHFRAEQSFIEDLSKLYYEDDMKNTSFVIPWYIFVDENGHIVEKHFKRPSVIVSTKTLFN